MPIEITPAGTRGAGMPGGKVMTALLAPMMKLQIATYRRSGGRRPSRMMGFPVVLLTTRGARSGRGRTTPLGGFPDGDDAWLVVASKAGAATHPAWFFNMARNPDDIWLEVGKRRIRVRGESLLGEEREGALRRIAAIAPRYGKYQAKTDREIPIVRLTATV